MVTHFPPSSVFLPFGALNILPIPTRHRAFPWAIQVRGPSIYRVTFSYEFLSLHAPHPGLLRVLIVLDRVREETLRKILRTFQGIAAVPTSRDQLQNPVERSFSFHHRCPLVVVSFQHRSARPLQRTSDRNWKSQRQENSPDNNTAHGAIQNVQGCCLCVARVLISAHSHFHYVAIVGRVRGLLSYCTIRPPTKATQDHSGSIAV